MMSAVPSGRIRCAYVSYSTLPSAHAHGIQVLSMCEALGRAGCDVTLHVMRAPGYCGRDEDLLTEYGVDGVFRIVWHDPLWERRFGRLRRFTAGFLAGRGSDVVYTRNPTVALGAWLGRSRFVYEVHDPGLPRLERLFAAHMMRSRRCTVVAISRRLANEVNVAFSPRDVIVEHDAYRPMEPERAPSARQADGRVVVTYLGSLLAGRGVESVVVAAGRIPEAMFRIVGGTAEEAGLSARELAGNVRFEPRVPHRDVPRILGESDILVMPYSASVSVPGGGDTGRFCSPLKLFEYLGSGKAIVASGLEGVSEVLADGVNALVVTPGDERAFCDAVGRLVGDAGLRRQLGERALADAAQHTWTGRVERILEHLGL